MTFPGTRLVGGEIKSPVYWQKSYCMESLGKLWYFWQLGASTEKSERRGVKSDDRHGFRRTRTGIKTWLLG
jgi:hypothetical protein